ncbi:hypothetical protein ACYBSK_25055 [Streptomyces sp. BYX5S]
MGRSEREAVADGARLHATVRALLDDHARAVRAVREALDPLLDESVARVLDTMPVARLQEATDGRVRVGLVERDGLRTDKSRQFDAYARRSSMAEATPDAVDVSDAEIARRIVEEEQARLGVAAEG